MKKLFALILALMLLIPAALADSDPLIYRVTDGKGGTLYLFGTVHVGREDMYPLPEDVLEALENSDALAVEADVTEEVTGELLALYMEYMYYSKGDCLSDHFAPETMDLITGFLEGYPLPMLDVMRPITVQALVEQALLSEYPAPGVDETLIGMAREQGKQILEVEGARFQLEMFPLLPESVIEMSIVSLLEDPEAGAAEMAALVDAWVAGDEAALTELCLISYEGVPEELLADLAEYERLMYTDRNIGMAETAAEYLESGDTVFFAVGAAHLLGEGGLAELLRWAGYTVERF